MHFHNCHTPDELKLRYRDLCKLLHPDRGGDKAQFQQMQAEYEPAKRRIDSQRNVNTMPDYFTPGEGYEYQRRPVTYVGVVYNHYYRFTQAFGADILIDSDHLGLIRKKYAGIG